MILFFIFHMLFASIFSGLLALVGGQLLPWMAWTGLIGGAGLAFVTSRSFRAQNKQLRFANFSEGGRGLVELIVSAFVVYVAMRHYMWLLFPVDHDWATLSAFNFGDLPLHINYTRFIAQGGHFPPVDPIFSIEPLRYPFGVDFYSALYECIGVPLRSHLFFVGIFSVFSSLLLLRTYGGWWAVLALFLSGGWMGWSVLTGQPLVGVSEGVEWKNLFLSVFLTQRGFLFALPAGLLLLQIFERHIKQVAVMSQRQTFAFELLWGFFPWFHLHVFVIVSLMMGCLAFLNCGWRKGARTLFQTRFFAIAIIPASLFVLHSTAGFQKAAISHWKWGWMFDDNESFFSFLNYNFGPWLWLPVAIFVSLLINRPLLETLKRRQLIREFVAAFFLFVLFFNFILAPWPWDNIKILIWPYLWMVRIAYLVFDEAFDDWTRAGVAAVMGLSGFMVLAWSIQSPVARSLKIFHYGEIANAEGSLQHVPIDAVFAASPTHDHPLAYLGRVRALGYLGHLWSHGIDSTQTEHLQAKLMQGDPDWIRIAHQMGVTHIFWGPWERLRYGDRDRVWMHLSENVSHVKGFEVYAIPKNELKVDLLKATGLTTDQAAGSPAAATDAGDKK